MIVKAIKTERVRAGSQPLTELLNKSIDRLSERSIVVITSKVVSLCENRVVPIGSMDKEELIKQEADYYLPATISSYGYHFTFTHNTLISSSGIDESNGDDNYVLWPKKPQVSANKIRKYLKDRFQLTELGVMITDSSCLPARYGTLVIPISHSGFLAINDYRGQPDLFGRPFEVSQAAVAGGLAAAAGVVMGEGTEQTPIAVIEDLPFVQFQDRDPTKEELEKYYIPPFKDDLFSPFLNSQKWQKGGKK